MQATSELRPTATHYGAATEALESTAKWLVTAFAAVGALMIGGVQLTELGTLGRAELPRLTAAVASLAVAVVAVGYMIRETSAIFMTEWVTLAELSYQAFEEELEASERKADEAAGTETDGEASEKETPGEEAAGVAGTEAGAISKATASAINEVEATAIGDKQRDIRNLLDKVDYAREELYGHVARSIPQLHHQLRIANEYAAEVAAGKIHLTWPDQDKVFRKVHELHNAARNVVECANYHRTRQHFNNLRKRLKWAVVVVLLSVLVFAYVTNPPKNEPVRVQPVRVQLVPPSGAQ
jgi:hypothetical protein